jgi:L-histidine N-alpha-methyltransferase
VDVEQFEHVAVWDPDHEWIEMRLRARIPQRIEIPELGLTAELAAGEEIRTEVSAKFRRERVTDELAAAGYRLDEWWTDTTGRFALSLATVTGDPEGPPAADGR